ncbi:MAG: hypothetical protein QXL01_07300 [Thermoplasmatales archaeon]
MTKTVRRIQYQTAKLEVIEFLFWHGKNNQPSLETEMAYNMVSTLRQNLFNASEACLDASLDTVQLYVASLQDTLVGATNFLTQMSSGLTSTEMQVVFLKELFNNIVSELITLNAELSDGVSQAFQQPSDNSTPVSQFLGLNYQQPSSVAIDLDSTESMTEQQFKNLINKCMGDAEKAERLIQYECQRNSQLDRDEAIRSAIIRWESDNR